MMMSHVSFWNWLWKSQVSRENLVHFATYKELQKHYWYEVCIEFCQVWHPPIIIIKKVWEKIYWFRILWMPGCIIIRTIQFWCCWSWRKPANETIRNSVGFLTLIKIFGSGNTGCFFLYLPEKFRNFGKFTTRILAMFGSTYLCEQLFSFMKSTKSSQRTFVIPHQTRHYTEISTTHTRNYQQKETSSLGTKQRKSLNSCRWMSVLNLCIMHFFAIVVK